MRTNDDKASPREDDKVRLPYEPPAIEETAEFETLALACGHVEGSPSPSCDPDFGGQPGS